MMKKRNGLGHFIRWVLPPGQTGPGFCIDLVALLVGGRHSIYKHFRSFRAIRPGLPFKRFMQGLAAISVPDSADTRVPRQAELLARLVRTIGLTGRSAARTYPVPRVPGDEGFVNHPDFTYGEDLSRRVASSTRSGYMD